MRSHFERSPAALLGCLGTVLFAGCAAEVPTGTRADQQTLDLASATQVSVCHRSGSSGSVVAIPRSQLAIHLSQGDYVTTLVVGRTSADPNDSVHFRRIGDAIAAARAGRLARGELQSAACRITINIAAGSFRGSGHPGTDPRLEHWPLTVDVPDLTLHGAFVMQLDSHGRATGAGVGPLATTLAPIDPLGFYDTGAYYPLVLAFGHPGGSAGNGLVVEGFVMRSGWPDGGWGGNGVFSSRVSGLTVRGNRFERGFDVTFDLRTTSAALEQNSIIGTGLCDMCLAGPGVFQVSGNLLQAGALEGIQIIPAVLLPVPRGVEPDFLPATIDVSGDIANNEVRDHLRVPVGSGIRVGALGLFAWDVPSTSHYTIHDNLLVNNRFAMTVDAAFPVTGALLKGDMDVSLSGNVMQQSCQTNLLVGFSRHTTDLGLQQDAYLLNSTYRLHLGGNIQWKDAWYSHPAGFGNTLLVDGNLIPNGTRQSYSPERCPGRQAPLASGPVRN
jgi:hypothetical protein